MGNPVVNDHIAGFPQSKGPTFPVSDLLVDLPEGLVSDIWILKFVPKFTRKNQPKTQKFYISGRRSRY